MSLCVAALAGGLQVTVPDKKQVAMLFQPTLLRCHFSTSSRQPAVVQWKFKSYCQDRMGESLGLASPRAQALSKRNLEWDPYLDCLDSRRTVRVVASKQGSTVTLGDFYRGREVTIVHGNQALLWIRTGGTLVPDSHDPGMLASQSLSPPRLIFWDMGAARIHRLALMGSREEHVTARVDGAELGERPSCPALQLEGLAVRTEIKWLLAKEWPRSDTLTSVCRAFPDSESRLLPGGGCTPAVLSQEAAITTPHVAFSLLPRAPAPPSFGQDRGLRVWFDLWGYLHVEELL